MKKRKKEKFPLIWLILYVISIIVLIVEAAIPGEQSAEQSNKVGNTLADFFNDVEGDQTVAVIPENLTISNKIDKGFVGETYKLNYEITPSDSTYKSVIFSSSNPNVVSINNEGVLSFLSVGTASISITNDHYTNISDSFDITIYNVEATAITSSILDATYENDCYILYIGKEYTINTLFTPENTTIKDLNYIYNDKYLNINENGVITPLTYSANKMINITISHFSLEYSLNVEIEYENIIKLDSLSLSIPNNKIHIKESIEPLITINPSNATFSDYILKSSNTSIAKIEKNKIIGVKEGNVTISIQSTTYEDIFENVEIEILPQPEFTDFKITTKQVFVNEEIKLKYELVPKYAKKPTSITYESINPDIATISNDGVLKGVNIGKAKIKITMDNITNYINITVKSDQVTGNEDFNILVKNNLLNYGQDYRISDIFEISEWFPEPPRDKEMSYSFESESNGVIDNENIRLTNLGENKLYITHNYTNITKSISLNCIDYNYLILDSNNNTITSIDINVNKPFFFKISDTQPVNNKPQTYKVSLSNNKIASILPTDEGYEIKTLDEGNLTLYIKSYIDNVNVDNLVININSSHIYTSYLNYRFINDVTNEEVIVENDNVNIYINGDYSIKTITSIDATKEKIRYTSSDNSILSIDSSGNLSCKGIGTSTIKIYDELSKLYKSITVNIYNYIKLDADNPLTLEGKDMEILDDLSYAITNGFSGKIKLNFVEDSTYTTVTYKSSDETIATIGKDGTITPLKEGETIITVICDDGMQKRIEFDVKLKIKRQDYIKNLTDFIYDVRKGLGHFSAFLILGIFSTFTWLLLLRYKKLFLSIPINYISGFIIACITELIQVYVPGRCGVFDDVILDFNGFLVSSSILTVLIIIHQIRVYIKHKKQDI